MMNGKGMMVICGNSVAELEKELEMLKLAISTGATMGCGGATLGEAEKALSALKSAVGGVPPIVEGCGCHCECCGGCDCEDDICPVCGDILEDGYCLTCGYPDEEEDDEEEEYCPNCGDILDEDGYCDNCGYPDEDEMEEEEPTPSELLHALMECLEDRGERTAPIGALLDLLDGMM